MVLIRANVSRDGLVRLQFPFARDAVDLIKTIPGMRWNTSLRVWETSRHGLAALRMALQGEPVGRLQEIVEPPSPSIPILWAAAQKLRDYQIEGTRQLLANPGFMLTMQMRTGKTRTAITAAASALAVSAIHRVLVFYPNQAKHEWINQSADHISLRVDTLAGRTPFSDAERLKLIQKPWNVIGCHHEIMGDRRDDLFALAKAGPFALIVDEVHMIKNRKAPRTKVLLDLAALPTARFRWLSTGTPLRNRPEDMWVAWEILQPGCMGSFWQFAKRYANAHENDMGFYDTKGASNEPELAERLRLVSYRVTRAQVAQHLPKADRATIIVDLSGKEAARYRAQEKAVAGQLGSVLDGNATASAAQVKALERLAQLTMPSKINVALERLRFHCEDRKVKVVVFANFHDSLLQVEEKLTPTNGDPVPLAVPIFCAGGWILPEKRKKVIDEWKAHQGACVLLANTMSSGTGIDLADADVALFVELAWVPSDVLQAESRLEDVHLGKRVTPALLEYLLARGTVDQDMALSLLKKLQNIDNVVGRDNNTAALSQSIKDTGLVDRGELRLDRTDPDAVQNAITRLRDRLMGKTLDDADMIARAEVAATIADGLEDDSDDSDDTEAED